MKLLRDTNIGYSPISARERKIKDGSKYDYLFPKPEMKKTLLKEDGEVEDTIERMRNIVKDYSYQVRNLVKILKGKNRYESVKNVFDFVYNYIKYQVEDGEKLRTPAYTWYEAQVLKRQNPNDDRIGADCDCMSIFCGCCFREMKIPFAFRITGYASALGFCRGFQHVYTIAYDENGKEIICDPVYIEFNKEKEYAIQKTYTMSLNGTDIIMLSGLGDNEYVEQSDGSLGELNGRKKRKERRAKRKARRKARKEARKEKRAARRAIRKARKSGDKEALKAAKARKKAAKKKLKENRGGLVRVARKVGNAIKQLTVSTTMMLPREMFLLLLRLNFRGMAKRLATNEKAREKMKKIWRKFGGSTKAWQKAVEKGKNKKALFGSKKLKGFTELQLQQLGAVLDEWNVFDGATLGDIFTEEELGELGFATTSCGAAIASATPIIIKVVNMLKEMGENVPETADEAEAAGEEVETINEGTTITENTESEQNAENGASENESEIDTEQQEEVTESEETKGEGGDELDGVFSKLRKKLRKKIKSKKLPFSEVKIVKKLGDTDFQEFYYIDEVEGLNGETLGAGLFKKIIGGAKNIVAKRKAKKATKKKTTKKKATKKATKTIKRTKSKKEQRKSARQAKKEQRKANKAAKKVVTQTAPQPTPEPELINPDDIVINANNSEGKKLNQVINNAVNSEAGQMLKQYATDTAMQKASEAMDKLVNKGGDNEPPKIPNTQPPANSNKEEKKSWISEHKAVAVVGGITFLGLIGGGIYLATRKKE